MIDSKITVKLFVTTSWDGNAVKVSVIKFKPSKWAGYLGLNLADVFDKDPCESVAIDAPRREGQATKAARGWGA